MNILLVGGSCSLINSMILKLRKEGHRIFLLTGDKYRHNKYERVFEKYEFSYDCENLNDILESVNADVTILMGAFDTNYRWNGEEREIVLFISHLVNILVAYSVKNKKRLIFLSSDEIYNGNYTEDIKEEEPFSGVGIRADALSQAEEICDNFRINRSLDIITLRLDHLYNIPKERKDVNNICADMCLNCMCDGHIKAKTDHTFSLLYENDAVEYIYQFIKTSNHKYSLYNLSSNDVVSEVKLAAMIQKAMEIESNIVAFSDSNGRCVLSGNRFEREFGVHAFGNLEKNIKDMVSYMKKHESVFLKGDDLKLSWWKMLYEKWKWLIRTLFPFFENLVCFVPFFMMNNRTVGSEYFANLDPFLLYVLLFAIVYGQQQATFSAILAVAGYMFRQMYTRSSFAVLIDYNTYVWIAQLFILGLVVGYMRDQIRIMRLESQELEEHLHRQIVDIRDINESNVRVKEVMEQQLIDHKDSIGKIYSITAGLEQRMPDEVIFYAVEMLGKLMKTKDVALYNVVSKDYMPCGGEVVACTENDRMYEAKFIVNELKKMHITYLDNTHDMKALDLWKSISWDGFDNLKIWKGYSLYEYIGEHLGYRLVVRTVELKPIRRGRAEFMFEIENTGFGRVFQETELFLIMKNRNETREVPISMDMRKIQAGTRICGKTVIKLMEGRVSLKLQRKKDGRIIHFANKNSTDTLYLGSLHCGKIYLSEE